MKGRASGASQKPIIGCTKLPNTTNARQQLHEAREYCWSHAHKWWDEGNHRWHTDRDWDDRDHDHDHDRH
jgi:hypothetical protein